MIDIQTVFKRLAQEIDQMPDHKRIMLMGMLTDRQREQMNCVLDHYRVPMKVSQYVQMVVDGKTLSWQDRTISSEGIKREIYDDPRLTSQIIEMLDNGDMENAQRFYCDTFNDIAAEQVEMAISDWEGLAPSIGLNGIKND